MTTMPAWPSLWLRDRSLMPKGMTGCKYVANVRGDAAVPGVFRFELPWDQVPFHSAACREAAVRWLLEHGCQIAKAPGPFGLYSVHRDRVGGWRGSDVRRCRVHGVRLPAAEGQNSSVVTQMRPSRKMHMPRFDTASSRFKYQMTSPETGSSFQVWACSAALQSVL